MTILNAKLNTVVSLRNERTVIKSQEQLIEVIRHGVFNMNQKAVIAKFDIKLNDKKGPCKMSYAVATNSTQLNMFDFAGEETEIRVDGIRLLVGPDRNVNFTSDIVIANFGGDSTEGNRPLAIEAVKNNGVYLDIDNGTCYLRTIDGMLKNGMEYVSVEEEEIIKASLDLYVGFSWSNSEERNTRVTLINARKYNASKRFEILDNSLGGGLSYEISNDCVKFKDIQKLATRNGLQKTGAFALGEFGNSKWGVLLVEDKIQGCDDFNKQVSDYLVSNHGIEIDNFILDGQHIKNANWLVDVLESTHNIVVSEKVCAGIMEQERAVGFGNKSAGLYVKELIFKAIIETIKKSYKFTIIGNKDNIAAIHDKNSAKIPNMNGSNFMSMILDIAVPSVNAKTSDQLGSKLMYLDKVAASNAINNIAYENFVAMLDGTVDSSVASTKGSMSQILFGLNKEKALGDIYASGSLAKDIVKFAESAIGGSKLSVKGGSYRAQFDNTLLITGDNQSHTLGVTKEGFVECYCADVISKNRKAIRQTEQTYKANIESGMNKEEARELRSIELNKFMVGMAVKYPCPGNSEFEMFRFVTKQELKERVLESDMNNKELVADYFMDIHGGCIMIAPINILKHKLAGFDTDFDGLSVILEDRLVNIAKEAYMNGSITGSTKAPGYTVILNKAKRNDVDEYTTVVNAMKLERTFDDIDAALDMYADSSITIDTYESVVSTEEIAF